METVSSKRPFGIVVGDDAGAFTGKHLRGNPSHAAARTRDKDRPCQPIAWYVCLPYGARAQSQGSDGTLNPFEVAVALPAGDRPVVGELLLARGIEIVREDALTECFTCQRAGFEVPNRLIEGSRHLRHIATRASDS